MFLNYVTVTILTGFLVISSSEILGNAAGVFNFDMTIVTDGLGSGRRSHGPKNALRIRNDYGMMVDDRGNLRIRGGNVTDTKNFPYMAAIIINGRLWCAGAIVDENWVITAAHCLNYVLHVSPLKSLGQYVKVRVGSSRPHEGGTLVDVVGAVRHRKFEEEPVPHADVALLLLMNERTYDVFICVLHVSPLKSLGQYVKVRVGSSRPHEGGTLVDVVGAVRHPKFEEEPVPHADVALLKLAENLEFHDQVNLIKIYEGVKEPYAQSFVVVSGWGATRGSDTAFRDHTPDLLTARLKVRTQHYCVDAYQLVNGFQFTQDFFCASLRNGTRDACLFDAGAPAVQQNRLMGVMSFGPERCGHEYQPAVFIKAFYFRDFVKSTIASYKSTADLIEAMQEADPVVTSHHLQPVHAGHDGYDGRPEDVTLPDDRHD